MRPLVISLAANADWEYVRTWVLSLRATGYAGEVALVTANCEQDLYEECARHGVTTVDFDPADMATRHLEGANTGRFIVLSKALEERFPEHFVVSCDVRDIIFQADPFDFFGPDLSKADPSKLYVSGEGCAIDQSNKGTPPKKWKGGGDWTARKVKALFSERQREELRGRPIYNGGLLCGETAVLAGVMRLIYLMLYNTTRGTADQAALNVLIGIEPLRSHVVPIEVDDGWAIHLAAVMWKLLPEPIMPKIEDGVVKTHDGRIYAIVHQYDRHRQLRMQVERRTWEPQQLSVDA